MKAGENRAKNILITGLPGTGKTTVILRLIDLLKGRRLAGFYTEEIREEGERKGFRVASLSGGSGTLAHLDLRTGCRVGTYSVDVRAFEEIALPEFQKPCDALLIDEIGKMECFSERFVKAVRGALEGRVPLVATAALKGGGFIAQVKSRPDVEIQEVTRANRDEMPARLKERLEPLLGPAGSSG
jgi:nucleoside-triphosphatase